MARTQGDLTDGEILTIEELNSVANNSMIYKNNSGKYQAIAIGTTGTIITSNGTTLAPTFQANGGGVSLTTANEWTKTQNFNATTLTDGANISWDLESNQVSKVTLAGNRTLDNPTNLVDGATYILRVIQDGTGSRTLAFGTAYKFPGGTAPTLTITANAVDFLTFICDGASLFGVAQLDFS